MTAAHSPGLLLGLSRNLVGVDSEPRLFARHPGLIVPDGGVVPIDQAAGRWIVEGEIALIVGRSLHRASVAEATEAITGWTIANDVTALDLVAADGYSQEAKGTATAIRSGVFPGAPPDNARIEVAIDGALTAAGTMDRLRLSGGALLSWVSRRQRLLAGDIVLCGAPGTAAPIDDDAEIAMTADSDDELRHHCQRSWRIASSRSQRIRAAGRIDARLSDGS